VTLFHSEQAVGVASGTVTGGGSTTVDVTSGSAGTCPLSFVDAAGFAYNSTCTAALIGGGTADGRLSNAYSTAYTLRVNGNAPNAGNAAGFELAGQQAVYGPFGMSGVTILRKLFVPSGGRFARYLDMITNPTTAPVTIDVQVESALDGANSVVVDPATTGNTYAVTLADASTGAGLVATRPSLGHVFGSLGAAMPVNTVSFQRLTGTSYYRWTVTIAPGQSMTFMHFAFARDPNDLAGADTQGRALADLSDPNALIGMTADERARVVNFKLP
jgi:hypothetical protein